MKLLTIYDLLPLLKKGWVAMDKDGNWWWYKSKPIKCSSAWFGRTRIADGEKLSSSFNIAPFDGDWQDSLIEVEYKCSSKCTTSGQVKELHNLMKDPRYWKQQDTEMVKRVEEGFKRLYG